MEYWKEYFAKYVCVYLTSKY